MNNKLFFRTIVAVTFISQTTLAQLPMIPGVGAAGGGAEFFAGKYEGKPLIKVDVVGGLRLSGVYHVPVDTDLAELIAYAGGATDGANLDEVRVTSLHNGGRTLKIYDFYEISKENKNMPAIVNGDVVQIYVSKDSLARTAIWVGIFTGLTTVLLSALAFQNSRK